MGNVKESSLWLEKDSQTVQCIWNYKYVSYFIFALNSLSLNKCSFFLFYFQFNTVQSCTHILKKDIY